MERFEKQMARVGADAQSRKVLQYIIDHGSINPAEAWFDLGVYRLASRINGLRCLGIQIHSEIITLTSEKGATRRFAQYSLVESEVKA